MMSDSYYALRYQPDTPMALRRHKDVVGRFETYEAAEDERDKKDRGDLMEVVYRDNDVKVMG